MAQAEKAIYYRALKGHGYEFAAHYRDYTTERLREVWMELAAERGLDPNIVEAAPTAPVPPQEPGAADAELREQIAHLTRVVASLAARPAPAPAEPVAVPGLQPSSPRPVAQCLDPNQHAGVTLNSHPDEEVVEIDEFGNHWYQKEVAKPGYPKGRVRRVLKYENPAVRQDTIKVGDYIESFEVADETQGTRPAEIKITLPSYQTGIYRAPNMPFKIHTYNGVRGFDFDDVQRFYGGADLVPDTIKRCYVSNDLCYDITTTIRAVNDEARELTLQKGM